MLSSIVLRSAINSQRSVTNSTQRCFSTTIATRQGEDQPGKSKNIGMGTAHETLSIIRHSINTEKAKPMADVGQRYQKIHHAGDIYHPQDLNDTRYQEQLRQRRGRPNPPTEDPFDVLGLDPLHEYKNYRLLSHFVSDMGKILPREKTGLTAKNQRKLAKAVKRARAMGIMSSTNKSTSSGYMGRL